MPEITDSESRVDTLAPGRMREPDPLLERPRGTSPRYGAAEEIALAVAAVFQLAVADLKGTHRTKAVNEARQCLYLVCARCTRLSSVEVGRFVDRHHTTVLQGVKGAQKLMARDRWFAAAVRGLLERFEVSVEGVQ